MDLADIDYHMESANAVMELAEESLQGFLKAMSDEYGKIRVEFVADNETQPEITIHRFSITGSPSTDLRKRAYRVLSEARNALDQAVFAACVAMDGDAKRTNTYFPFAASPTDFDTVLFDPKKGRCRDIPEALRPILRGLSPWWFDSAWGSGNDSLRTLGKLSGPNKHQVIIEYGPELVSTSGPAGSPGFAYLFYYPPMRSDLISEFETLDKQRPRTRTDFILAVTSRNGEINHDLQMTFVLCAKEATRLGSTPIDVMLEDFVVQSKEAIARIKTFLIDTLVT